MAEETRLRAKAHLFEQGITAVEIEDAWRSALGRGNKVVQNFDEHGMTAYDLSPHLIDDLMKRYG